MVRVIFLLFSASVYTVWVFFLMVLTAVHPNRFMPTSLETPPVTSPSTVGEFTIELRTDGRCIEKIPLSLLREAVNGLPPPDDEHFGRCRTLLIAWTHRLETPHCEDLDKLAEMLSQFSHEHPQIELGEIPRLTGGERGRLGYVSSTDEDVLPVAAPVILALAFRRLVLLASFGSELNLVSAYE